jgi:uncharacterized protein (DUF1330 family)
MIVVAILTVKREAIENFRDYEKRATEIMKDHGGRIERTVVVKPDGAPDLIKEIHVVRFPNDAAFLSYRNDARLTRISRLREQSVVHTEILVGEEGPTYVAS